MSDTEDIIGPALPPGFAENRSDDSDEDTVAGPALPPGYRPGGSSSSAEDSEQEEVLFKRGRASGPALPPGSSSHKRLCRDEDGPKQSKMRRVQEAERNPQEDDDDDGFFGPALPPGYQKRHDSPERPILGPALPPGFTKPVDDDDDDDDDSQDCTGPALPPDYTAEASSSDDDDGEVIGPLPPKGPIENTVAMEFERRAQKMKEKLISGGDDDPKEQARETWMIELPPVLQHIGLGARTFKKRAGPESKDRSLWTDTPADKERKIMERLEGKESSKPEKEEIVQPSAKDLKMAEKVSKYNESKRAESLISMHSKKMKKKSEEEAKKPQERRAFDRDQDLQVNRFDDAQKKVLLRKSEELNTRFSHSKGSMFL
ncbi:GPALPP motifs-containing protein 1 [Amia ocellicauda]|uniref:GPALPP motifs-containing protein 1 n=1 Tax=Amia ocellicauda TaxID=2972642 RepID=UPI003463C289